MRGKPNFVVGDVAITQMIEKHTQMPVDFLPTATPDLLDKHRDWLRPWALSDDDQLRFVLQALCLDYHGQKVIVDTCVGPRQLPEVYAWVINDGTFIDSLRDAGFGPDDVNLVICTHLHFDHIGWNTVLRDGIWVPTFPRARYIVPRREYEGWRSISDEVKAASNVFNLDDALNPLFEAALIDLVEPDHKVDSVLQLVSTPGHSPGHVSVQITSAGQEGLITGDCAHHPVQLSEPDWHTMADFDPARSSATRKWIIERYSNTDVLLIGTHFPPPSGGYLVSDERGTRLQLVGG